MGVVVEYLVNVHVENFRAIFLLDNTSASKRTNHIDVYYDLVRDYLKYGAVKVSFFRSEENLTDKFTKNLGNEPFPPLA